MALGGAARPLLVPAADVLAKNMRAYDPALAPRARGAAADAAASSAPTLLMTIGALSETDAHARKHRVRFRAAQPAAKRGALALLLARLFSAAPRSQPRDAAQPRDERASLAAALRPLWPPLEKAAALASRLPDPTVLFLALVLAVLLVKRYRAHWFHSVLVKMAAVVSFVPLLALALLWRKTELFAQLREGANPLSHPTEHILDDLEAELKAREENVKKAQSTLNANRAKLDALRKELAKDPNAADPSTIIVPSRKAAGMIAAGALGAGYDAEAAQAVEARRREESVKKSREEWRQKAEEVENNVVQTEESVKLLYHHASTAYSKRTREIKTRTSSGRPSERLRALKKAPFSALSQRQTVEDGGSRAGRLSEQTAASHAHSTGSSRRWSLFRRKRRRTTASSAADRAASLASTPRITAESGDDRR